MTVYAYPSITPQSNEMTYVGNQQVYSNPFTSAIVTVSRGGDHWRVVLRHTNVRGDNKAVLKGFLASLQGQRHRFTVHDHGHIQRGVLSGTPLVNGSGQLGNSLTIDGCGFGVTNWIRAGDQFSINGELKVATLDRNSDGGGNLILAFAPSLRTAPTNNTPIIVTNPTGRFVLDSNESGWTNRPGDLADFVISGIEDVAA